MTHDLLSYKVLSLHLRHPFTIARYTKTHQPSLIVKWKYNGLSGYGECTSNAYYHFDVELHGVKSLKKWGGELNPHFGQHPTTYYDEVLSHLDLHPFLRCALDQAYWDWYGKSIKKTTRELVNSPSNVDLTSLTIGIENQDRMKDKMREQPWPLYKIKLGEHHDAEFITGLLTVNARFYIDANAAWSIEKTQYLRKHLDVNQVLLIEQPMARKHDVLLKKRTDMTHLNIIADESCVNLEDIDYCSLHYDGVNIKLMKCGGISPAINLINKARSLQLHVMIGCMTESSVGIGAAAQIAGLADYVDLDGAMLLSNDPAHSIRWTPDGIVWPNENGNGVSWRHDAF